MELNQKEVDSIVNSRIEAVFKSHSLQIEITANWKVGPEFSSSETNRRILDIHATYDLASWSISNCPDCFQFLLAQHAITGSYFCRTGESFFWIARKNNKVELGACIVASMSYEHLLQPYLIYPLGGLSKSIFQSSTGSEPWFRICWECVKSQPQAALSSLGPHETGAICRFADTELAQELLNQGLDIGKPRTGCVSPWINVLDQKNPEAMFEWLWEHDYRPPEDFLAYAATECRVKAVGWITCHTDYQDWCQVVLAVAAYTDTRSAELLEILLQRGQFPPKKNEAFICDVLIKVVDEVCVQSQTYHGIYREGIFEQWKDDPSSFNDTISGLQETAVRKIRILKQLANGVGVVGMKVKTRHAELHRVTEALEDLDS
ncbi:hypothetical protein N7522_006451 [Penicillium canescens]|nr:hypothetical protein N7522_006451 [Penicillium canescens]